MTRVCPHSDAECKHGMSCPYTCATDAYDGTKALLPQAPDGATEGWQVAWLIRQAKDDRLTPEERLSIIANFPRSTPDSWRLVPVEPTEDMIAAGTNAPVPDDRHGDRHPKGVSYPIKDNMAIAAYRAMLAASPSVSPVGPKEDLSAYRASEEAAPSGATASWRDLGSAPKDGTGEDEIAKGLRDCSMGVPYGSGSVGEAAAEAAYAVLRCCNLIRAGDWRVPGRVGNTLADMWPTRTSSQPTLAPSQTGEENAGLVALDAMSWTRVGADYVPENTEGFRAGWRIHDFPADDKWAHFICDGIEDKEYADALVEAVNFALASRSPIPGEALQNQLTRNPGELAEVARMVAIYSVEEDEGRVHLSVCREPIAVHDINSPRGIALLKLDAALRRAATNPIPGELKALSDAATPGIWEAWRTPDGEWTVRVVFMDGDTRITAWPVICDAAALNNEGNARLVATAVNHVRQALAKTHQVAEGGEGG